MFTTFRKHTGEEYTVYSKDGKRYYVDWETQVSVELWCGCVCVCVRVCVCACGEGVGDQT